VRGAIRLHCPAGQKQTQNNAKHQLFLFGQATHARTISNPHPPTQCALTNRNVHPSLRHNEAFLNHFFRADWLSPSLPCLQFAYNLVDLFETSTHSISQSNQDSLHYEQEELPRLTSESVIVYTWGAGDDLHLLADPSAVCQSSAVAIAFGPEFFGVSTRRRQWQLRRASNQSGWAVRAFHQFGQ
jgi:hypothetical protein